MNIYGQIISYIGNFVGVETRVNNVTTYSQNLLDLFVITKNQIDMLNLII